MKELILAHYIHYMPNQPKEKIQEMFNDYVSCNPHKQKLGHTTIFNYHVLTLGESRIEVLNDLYIDSEHTCCTETVQDTFVQDAFVEHDCCQVIDDTTGDQKDEECGREEYGREEYGREEYSCCDEMKSEQKVEKDIFSIIKENELCFIDDCNENINEVLETRYKDLMNEVDEITNDSETCINFVPEDNTSYFIRYMDKISEHMDKISEKLDKSVEYSNYISENMNNTINYIEHINENKIDYNQFLNQSGKV